MITFPESFEVKPHPLAIAESLLVGQGYGTIGRHSDAKQWIYGKPNGTTISIVGGGFGLYGDGITTFEMYDFDEDGPRGYLTKEEINEYLSKITFIEPKKNIKKHKF